VTECTYPLTGVACVSRIYTDHGIVEILPTGLHVRSTYGTSLADLRDRTGLDLLAAREVVWAGDTA